MSKPPVSATNNERAFSQLFRSYSRSLLSYFRGRVPSREDAEDMQSRVFEKAWRGWPSLTVPAEKWPAWLYTIARNTLIDFIRARQSAAKYTASQSPEQLPASNEAEPLAKLEDESNFQQLITAISNFSVRDQFLIYYKYFQGLSNRDISGKLKISEGNVATKVHRLKKKLLSSVAHDHHNQHPTDG